MAALPGWLDDLAEGVVLVEAGRIIDLNRAAAEMLDVRPDRVRGAPVISAFRDHRLEAVAASGAGAAPQELEVRGRRLLAVPLAGGLLLRDLTALRRSQEDAHELLAVLSHELRTPVAAIRAVLDALAGDLTIEQRERFLGRAQAEAARLTRLLSDLTVEVRPPRERSVSLAAVLRRAVAVTQSVRDRHGVTVELAPHEADVWVDEDKLLQVAVNLIENAAVHGPKNSTVTVVIWLEGEFACLEVRDLGAPLDEAVAEELFAISSFSGRKAKGTGLGLYIVKSLASEWGGRAWGGPRTDGAHGNAFGASVPLVG